MMDGGGEERHEYLSSHHLKPNYLSYIFAKVEIYFRFSCADQNIFDQKINVPIVHAAHNSGRVPGRGVMSVGLRNNKHCKCSFLPRHQLIISTKLTARGVIEIISIDNQE